MLPALDNWCFIVQCDEECAFFSFHFQDFLSVLQEVSSPLSLMDNYYYYTSSYHYCNIRQTLKQYKQAKTASITIVMVNIVVTSRMFIIAVTVLIFNKL